MLPVKKSFLTLVLLLLAGFVAGQEKSAFSVCDSEMKQCYPLRTDQTLTSLQAHPPETDDLRPFLHPAKVIGKEDWHQVDGEKWPYSALVYLEIKSDSGKVNQCSGALIGPYTVLTAAHCVRNQQTKKLASPSNVTAYAGRKGSSFSEKGATIIYLRATQQEYNSGEYDFAAIVLDSPLGNKTGYFGARGINMELGYQVDMMGFPGYKTPDNPWVSPGKITCVSDQSFCHNADSQPGSSGSPIFLNYDFQRGLYEIVAVHVNTKTSANNGATSPNSDLLFYFIDACRNKKPSTQASPTGQEPRMSDEETLRTLQQQLQDTKKLQTKFL
jgi:V8-like Glu-specific endopeptidase